MRKIREVLRLKYECKLSEYKIAISCNISRGSVRQYLIKAKRANITWPLEKKLDDTELENLLFPSLTKRDVSLLPSCKLIHKELKRKGVTLWLLWEEYKSIKTEGISYSRYCQIYRSFKSTLNPVMRQTHKAGEKIFVDYSGMTVAWTNKSTGEINQAEIFVAVIGASNYTYAEATRSQALPDWINSHVRAFEFFGGVTEIIVPDNLKSGVTSAHHYDPEINMTYQEMANYYDVAIVPTRVRAPKDKAKVEAGVLGVERQILAKIRNHKFFSVEEVNVEIRKLLKQYNQKPFQQLSGSRTSQFLELDQPALKALPKYRYEYAEWKKIRVGMDYHIFFEHHYYSVPYKHIKHQLEVRITRTLLECFYKGKLIASHKRAYNKGHTLVKEHMPISHREYANWTTEKIISSAEKIGGNTTTLINEVVKSRPQPQQAFRTCVGIIRLEKSYGKERMENASKRALALGAYSYKSIASILKNKLDQKPLTEATTTKLKNDNVRGAEYYH